MSKTDCWRYPNLRVWIALSIVLVIQANSATERHKPAKIKNIIEELKRQMGILQEIEIALVSKNDLIVSVKPRKERNGVFEVSFERAFLNTLDDEELRAVIAHELGHVWIFTHRPYLQTEALANSIAYKAVKTEVMDRVYEKVRSRTRVASNLSASVH